MASNLIGTDKEVGTVFRIQPNNGPPVDVIIVAAPTPPTPLPAWLEGNGPPAPTLGNVGDFYLNGANGDVYTKTGLGWGTAVCNIHGAPGMPGSTWFEQAGPPGPGVGNPGDFDLNTSNGDVYQKSPGNIWGLVGNIQGVAGLPGSTWYEQAGAPGPGVGVPGDFDLDVVTGDVYQKSPGNIWVAVGNIKGAPGTPGSVWFEQAGAPGPGVGNPGDFDLNTTNGDVYQKSPGNIWVLVGNIEGPPGTLTRLPKSLYVAASTTVPGGSQDGNIETPFAGIEAALAVMTPGGKYRVVLDPDDYSAQVVTTDPAAIIEFDGTNQRPGFNTGPLLPQIVLVNSAVTVRGCEFEAALSAGKLWLYDCITGSGFNTLTSTDFYATGCTLFSNVLAGVDSFGECKLLNCRLGNSAGGVGALTARYGAELDGCFIDAPVTVGVTDATPPVRLTDCTMTAGLPFACPTPGKHIACDNMSFAQLQAVPLTNILLDQSEVATIDPLWFTLDADILATDSFVVSVPLTGTALKNMRPGNAVHVRNGDDGALEAVGGTVVTARVATIPTAPITVGTTPDALAISLVGGRALVANSGSNDVTPFAWSGTAWIAGAPIAVGTAPNNVAITPDGLRALVLNSGSDNVTPLAWSGAAWIPDTPVAVGTGPNAVAITPDGLRALVVNYTTNNVTPLAWSGTAWIPDTPVAVGTAPQIVAITSDGLRALVTNSTSNDVTPLLWSGGVWVPDTPVSVGTAPDDVAITPDGLRALVVNYTSNNVTPLAWSGAAWIAAAPVAVGTSPYVVAITPDGLRALVANNGSNDVTPLAWSGAAWVPDTSVLVGTGPDYLAISPDGLRALVTNSTSGDLTPLAWSAGAWIPGAPLAVGTAPGVVGITPDGLRALVVNYGSNNVNPFSWYGSAWIADGPLGLAITVHAGSGNVPTGSYTCVAWVGA